MNSIKTCLLIRDFDCFAGAVAVCDCFARTFRLDSPKKILGIELAGVNPLCDLAPDFSPVVSDSRHIGV